MNDAERSAHNLHDPKGLIREAYCIDGITGAECRSIFLDWALSVPVEADSAQLITALLEQYAGGQPDHPMTIVLREGLATKPSGGRRGGRAGRLDRA